MRKIWIATGCVLILALVAGCGYLENKGSPRENIKPVVFITNVPSSSVSSWMVINVTDTIITVDTLTGAADTVLVGDTVYNYDVVIDTATYPSNPRLYWFGTDEDGRVDAFEYAVVPTDSLIESITDPPKNVHPAGLPTIRDAAGQVNPLRFSDVGLPGQQAAADSLDWVLLLPGFVDVVNSATVFLFADIDTSKAIDQFLFVRAIDNLGLRSDIKFARYSRQNHPPETYITLRTIDTIRLASVNFVRTRKYYSLPQSTQTYPGIDIGWSGSDSIDFPDEQPPFEYNWVLYGPFADSMSAVSDSGRIRRTNDDLLTPRLEWTDQEQATFFNLRSGWYLFEVRARDDAFVADPEPARRKFQVVEPSFDKDFLLMDATNWTNGVQLNVGSLNFRDVRFDSLHPDTVRREYEALFVNQGYVFSPTADVWYRQSNVCSNCLRPLPDRDVLSRYKALVIYEEDMQVTLDQDNNIGEFASVLGEYMDVGGRVVLIGRNLFASSVTGWTSQSPAQEATLTAADWGWEYFGVTRMYFAGSIEFAQQPPHIDASDFVGTLPLDPDFPVVTTDTMRTLSLSQLPIEALIDRDGNTTKDWNYIPDVNWIGIDRNRNANGFYQFSSSDPNNSPSQGRICGARYEFFDQILGRPTFRTAIVTFPLFPLEHDGSVREMVSVLLDYILE